MRQLRLQVKQNDSHVFKGETEVCESIEWAPDTRWTSTGHETVEAMMARFALPNLVTGIPEELETRLNRISRCLQLSFVDYELFDIILEYAVVTVELAFKRRYEVHFGKPPKCKLRFKDLIDWAHREGLLEGLEKKTDFLRQFRNDSVHPNKDSFGGVAFAPVSRYVFEVVNSLFSDECMSMSGKGTTSVGAG